MSDIVGNQKEKTRLIQLRPIQVAEQEMERATETSFFIKEEEIAQKLQEADRKLKEAELETEKRLQEAEKIIEQQKQAWEQEKSNLVEKARKEGLEAGYKEGRQQGYQEAEGHIKESRQVVEQAKEDYQQIIDSSETTILEIALRIAEKIMKHQLTETPEDFLPLVKRVIAEVHGQPEVIVSVHPDQYSLVLAQKDELELFTSSKSVLTIYPTTELEPFSCKVESSFGSIDASIDSQLTELRKQLLEVSQEGGFIES
ncbi:flagellar assembly protein FliH [Thalassobacillus cyri]|uniref:Flagellar assembly protein FliH n=1 Tax=Thalassobacillus cyri TaxID=571932 RepID=A0A1H4G1E1_9BACI|nr:flagellar assembly protein FliH [Thalassobacillus cyri]SEB03334.1 flagellar assembly protein FliH [Thalassobacillus cyri]